MQGSVHSFDEHTRAGSVLLDTGRLLEFDAQVFARSGLRLLRLGQRVSLQVQPADPEDTEARVTRLWLVGVPETDIDAAD